MGFLDWRPPRRTPYNWMPDWARRVRPTFLYPCYPRNLGEFYFGADSRLLFLAEFLESGIAAQRIPDRIESKKGRRNGRPAGIRGIGRL